MFIGRSNTAFGERKGSAFRAADSQTTHLFSSKPSSIERELDRHSEGPLTARQKADEYLSSGSGGKSSARGPGTARNDCRSRSKGCSSEEREAEEKRKNAGVAATIVQKSHLQRQMSRGRSSIFSGSTATVSTGGSSNNGKKEGSATATGTRMSRNSSIENAMSQGKKGSAKKSSNQTIKLNKN